MISDRTIDEFQAAVSPEVVEFNGKSYLSKPAYNAPAEPQPATLTLHSLTALIDYMKSVGDITEGSVLFIHVESPSKVSVASTIYGANKQRDILVVAKFEPSAFPFGTFQSNEDFNVFLQARFDNTEDRDKILKVVGNLKDEKVTQFTDDGTTQAVTARAGIARVEEIAVPNPVRLAPFRTFPEVDQPESPFILRMRQGSPLPQCALFEADGGAWANTARESIKEFLAAELPDTTILA